MIFSLFFGLLAAHVAPAAAYWRMGCPGRLMDQRMDPIIAPGEVSAHVHTIAGGNGLNWTMDYGLTQKSTCSSCPIKQDLSNYWTPKLYYHNSKNKTFTMVPQAGDGNGVLGGMTVYYLQRPGYNNDKLHAFPKGFRMIAGNPFQRNYTGTFAAQGISFVCLNYNGAAPVPEGNKLPDVNCPDGVRAQVFFPSCWDGKTLYSPDQSHIVYPESGAYNNGNCPKSHPVHMISLFYEVIYQTNLFANMWHDGKQPFVFAMGDPTGYGFHGDFVNGWDVPTLQKSIDDCTNDSGLITDCPHFDFFSDEEAQNCRIPQQVHERIHGPLDRLPGCNPIQDGPGYATNHATTCPTARDGTIGSYFKHYTDMTKSLRWRYLGCALDDVADRTFPSQMYGDDGMTLQKCIQYCHSNGYRYAGAEYATQCFCSNSLRQGRKPTAGSIGHCSMHCGGNKKELCGGPGGLSVYERCDAGQSCHNAVYHHVG